MHLSELLNHCNRVLPQYAWTIRDAQVDNCVVAPIEGLLYLGKHRLFLKVYRYGPGQTLSGIDPEPAPEPKRRGRPKKRATAPVMHVYLRDMLKGMPLSFSVVIVYEEVLYAPDGVEPPTILTEVTEPHRTMLQRDTVEEAYGAFIERYREMGLALSWVTDPPPKPRRNRRINAEAKRLLNRANYTYTKNDILDQLTDALIAQGFGSAAKRNKERWDAFAAPAPQVPVDEQ